jgi:16S rRNA (cytosine967-C5)-methyltransferase
MSAAPASGAPKAWPAAASLVARWLDRRERIDALLDELPRAFSGPERARCQHLVLGVVRHFGRIDAALTRLVAHPPRFPVRAALFIAGFEIIDAQADRDDGRIAKIVHHAVEQAKALASPAEAKLVNAVVRKLAGLLGEPAPTLNLSAGELGEYFSHPAWLVQIWLTQFGPEATRALLEWNQSPATLHGRWRATGETPPDFFKPTARPAMFELPSGRWPEIEALLKAGKLYLQDPSTCIPVELLAPQPGERVLDLCAAPGGKSLLIADTMTAVQAAPANSGPAGAAPAETVAQPSQLVALDQPGARIDRLKENLARTTGIAIALVQADALGNLALALRAHQLAETFDAVLLDAPCTNTGVMRHRVDVKWRLQAGDFRKHHDQQLSMLHAAAKVVAPGGRLVYSTCSLDRVENENVVTEFLAGKAGGPFELEKTVLSYPWKDRHDGAGAFLLRRSTSAM